MLIMTLNPECLRAVLLSIESLSEIQEDDSSFIEVYPDLEDIFSCDLCSKYKSKDVVYCLKCLCDEKLISGEPLYGDGAIQDFSISGITPDGRKFLDKIRDNSIFKNMLSKIKGAGISFSVANLFQLSLQAELN